MQEDQIEKKERESVGGTIFEWLKVVLMAVIIAFLVQNFLLSSTKIVGKSMFPTLYNGDKLLVNRVFFMAKNPKYGDIIEFHAPDGANKDYIKRVIGLPGDRIAIVDGKVLRNGEILDEPYTSTDDTLVGDVSEWTVEENTLFVLGDNRLPEASKDSRSFGVIDRDSVVGIAFFRFAPLSRMGGV